MNKAIIFPLIMIPLFATIFGLMIIPEYVEQRDDVKTETMPTIEKGIAEAMVSECGAGQKPICDKLDKIIENQEVMKDYLIDIYDLGS